MGFQYGLQLQEVINVFGKTRYQVGSKSEKERRLVQTAIWHSPRDQYIERNSKNASICSIVRCSVSPGNA